MTTQRPEVDPESLDIRITHSATETWCELAGEIDLSNHHDLLHALVTLDLEGRYRIYIDLQALTFCDIAGCDLLLSFQRSARLRGHEVNLLGAQPIIRKVMNLLLDWDRPSFC